MTSKYFTCLFILLIGSFTLPAQDSVLSRVIFIGDAGEMNPGQSAVIKNAADHIIPGKTTVLFLGDNVYPRGMGLPGSKEEKKTQEILQSQFMPMRSKGAPVYFVPGNHDWDKMGPKGLEKIKRQWQYLNSQHDSLLRLVPPDGCPDPVEINVSDSLTIIAFDSEWWLFPFSKSNPWADCDCRNKDEIIDRLDELAYKNRYKIILLASHHPFQTYGHHGGYFNWKDHLFPFTALNKNLYIPLPGIGSLYPFLRKTFSNPEDAGHPLYEHMIRDIDNVFAISPNFIHVAGHEHGLQFIKSKQIQVVSGAGAKESYIKKGKHALFAETIPGFVTADLLPGNTMRFTYHTWSDSGLHTAFTYEQPYTNVKPVEDAQLEVIRADSLQVSAYKKFDEVSKVHRFFFGENYRKEWAALTKFPVIRISEIHGGLTPLERGGGHQTRSLRLEDKSGKEWVLRSVQKYPEVILPEQLRETFAKDIVVDAMSAQHPYSALMVPPLANAAGVPHTHPMIGIVAPDKQLGRYSRVFANTICLLEEREPLGKSVNTIKMLNALNEDNDNNFDSTSFLRARLLDLFIGDWDRHIDQWRFVDEKKGKGKHFLAVPRDRDQALYTNQGVFPYIESREWVQPFFEGFNPKIRKAGTLLFTSTLLNARLLNQFSYDEWMKITRDFMALLTDSVLESSLQQLPQSAYQIRHDALLKIMKARRDNLPKAMDAYYHFLYKSPFIRVSDKNELVEVRDANNEGMQIVIHKLSKDGEVKEQLFSNTFYPSTTREIRLFTGKGNDSIMIDNKNAAVCLRITGGDGNKKYHVVESKRKVSVYEKENNAVFSGDTQRLRKHLSDDTLNTAIIPGNLFNATAPLISGGFNLDDGFLLGAGFRHVRGIGYLSNRYSMNNYRSMQQFTVSHSFSTNAFRIRYNGEWLEALGKADLLLQASAFAPDNTQNFFGTGNETPFIKAGDYKRFYRARFDLYNVNPALRWKTRKDKSIIIGPSFQYYHYDTAENKGRYLESNPFIHSYDSTSIAEDKMHAGLLINYVSDSRNNALIPTWGSYVNIKLLGYAGLNNYSKSFAQLTAEIDLYKSVNPSSTIVIAERLGGAATVGKPAFYQSVFLGGQENLLGYRQFRFAGQHMLYNNLEARIKLTDIANYILPGQIGLTGFFDIGRVWEREDHSDKWHNGYGGGIYFTPAQMLVLQLVMGHSPEGWYPYFTMGFRF